MASTNSTTDGMGFEELGQTGSQPVNTWLTGSVTADGGFKGNLTGSVVGNVTGDITGNVIGNIDGTTISGASIRVDNEGLLHSISVGSPITYGATFFVGSFDTSAGSVAFISLGKEFSAGSNFYITTTPCGSATGVEESYVSGVRHTSGVNFVGAASLRYNYFAVGI